MKGFANNKFLIIKINISLKKNSNTRIATRIQLCSNNNLIIRNKILK
jgi:hypothetical protein